MGSDVEMADVSGRLLQEEERSPSTTPEPPLPAPPESALSASGEGVPGSEEEDEEDDDVDDEEEDSENGEEDSEHEEDEREGEHGTQSVTGPAGSSSIAITNDDDNSGGSGGGGGTPSVPRRPVSIPVLVHPSTSPPPNLGISAPPSASAGPSTSASPPAPPTTTTTTTTTASKPTKPTSSAKPRSSKPPKPTRSPSPSPPPPVAAPPVQTIRLEIRLGGPENYEVDIAREARETGQRPPEVVELGRVGELRKVSGGAGGGGLATGGAGAEESETGEETGEEGKKKGKRKKKNATSEYYDISDPFIDDSELALDERTYFAQTKQQGFYVSSGEVALLKDKTPKKPKSKKHPLGLASAIQPSTSHTHDPSKTHGATIKKDLAASVSAMTLKKAEGTQDSPIALGSDGEERKSGVGGGAGGGTGVGVGEEGEGEGEEKAGMKRKRYVTVVEGGKKRKVVDVNSFHPELQASIEELKKAIAAESWTQKGKFPPALKPLLSQLAIQAIKLDEYDEHFFNLMPTLFPYNKFTMTKLIKRTVFQDHTALLMERQEALLLELAQVAQEGFTRAQEEWEKAVVAWDKRQDKARQETANGGSAAGTAGNGESGSAGPTRHPTEEMDVDHPSHTGGGAGGEHEGGEGGKKEHENKPPQKRYRLTEQMKSIVWQLVLLSNECCRLENEKNTLEGSIIQVSEQGGRKVLYQKIVAAFPEGWMNSGQISRDVSVMKKKYEKEQMENEV